MRGRAEEDILLEDEQDDDSGQEDEQEEEESSREADQEEIDNFMDAFLSHEAKPVFLPEFGKFKGEKADRFKLRTKGGDEVNLPTERTDFNTLFTFKSKNWDSQVRTNPQGPHTISHIFTSQLFEEAVKDMNGLGTGLQAFFEKQVPSPEEIAAIFIREGITLEGERDEEKGEGLKVLVNNQNPSFFYTRFFQHYKELYHAIQEALESDELDDALFLNLRAILDLHPYATYSWKGKKPGNKIAKSSTAGKNEHRVPGLRPLDKATSHIDENIDDGLAKGSFVDGEAYLAFVRNRLEMVYTEEEALEILRNSEKYGKYFSSDDDDDE